MNSLLDNQKIRKRRYSAPVSAEKLKRNLSGRELSRERMPGGNSSKKTAFRPAGISALFERNSRFIDMIDQEPARVQRRNYHAGAVRKAAPSPRRDRETNGRTLLLFTLPGVPLAALCLFALGVFFINLRQEGGLPDWVGREVAGADARPASVRPADKSPDEKDPGSRYNLALYAGITPPAGAGVSPRNPGAAENTSGGGESIPLDLMEVFAWQDYLVKRGDSVSKIAADFSLSMDAIIASNGITNARSLKEGETLRIPNMDGIPYTVKAGDSLSEISKAMGVPLEVILDVNDIQTNLINTGATLFIPGARMNREDLKMALGELFMYPVKGARLTSPFGWRNDPFNGVRRHHAAVDLALPQGSPVLAAREGKVSALSYDNIYGNYIILSHPGGYQTMYAHLHTVSVKKGDVVGQGTRIGSVGSTGYSTGPHLHFGVFKNSRAVNPLDYLNPRR